MSRDVFAETHISLRTGEKASEHLTECGRKNGDGQSVGQRVVERLVGRGRRRRKEDVSVFVFCACALCDGARWIRNQAALGILSGEQAEGARMVMRALGGEP